LISALLGDEPGFPLPAELGHHRLETGPIPRIRYVPGENREAESGASEVLAGNFANPLRFGYLGFCGLGCGGARSQGQRDE